MTEMPDAPGRWRDRASAAWYPDDNLTGNGLGKFAFPAALRRRGGSFMPDPEAIYHWRRLDDRITTSGQPTEPQLKDLHALGIRHIVNLGLHSHEKALPDEAASVSRLGMTYIHIPVDFQSPTDQDFDQFCAVMEHLKDVPVHVHCIANYRVSALFCRYRRDGPCCMDQPVDAVIPCLRGLMRCGRSVEWSGIARSRPSRRMTEPISPSVCRRARRNTARKVSAVVIARAE